MAKFVVFAWAFLLMVSFLYQVECGTLLVACHAGNRIIKVDTSTGEMKTWASLSTTANLLVRPDTLYFNPHDKLLYVTVGTNLNNSAIIRFEPQSGQFLGRFDKGPPFAVSCKKISMTDNTYTGGPLFRPYGIVSNLSGREIFVSSFLSDEIIVYDALTGYFKRVLIRGDGM